MSVEDKKRFDLPWIVVIIVILTAFVAFHQVQHGSTLPFWKLNLEQLGLVMAAGVGFGIIPIIVGLIAFFIFRKSGSPKIAFLLAFLITFGWFLSNVIKIERHMQQMESSENTKLENRPQ